MTQCLMLVGGSSPIGRAVTTELQQRGHRVIPTNRSGAGIRLDVTNFEDRERELARLRPSTVIYLARPKLGVVAGTSSEIDTAVDALRGFAEQCAKHEVGRVIFASSAAVYGTTETTARGESDPTAASSPYSILKLQSEQALYEVASTEGFTAIALRIFNVYGADFAESLIDRLVLGGDEPAEVYDTDYFVRDYIHVTDVARAFAMAVETATPASSVLNVGTGIGTSNRALLSLLPGVTYNSQPATGPSSISVADISLIRACLGFDPLVRLEDAVLDPDRFFR